MNYFRAYLKAFWDLWCFVSFVYMFLDMLLVILSTRLDPAVVLFFGYIVAVAAIGGVFKELQINTQKETK